MRIGDDMDFRSKVLIIFDIDVWCYVEILSSFISHNIVGLWKQKCINCEQGFSVSYNSASQVQDWWLTDNTSCLVQSSI